MVTTDVYCRSRPTAIVSFNTLTMVRTPAYGDARGVRVSRWEIPSSRVAMTTRSYAELCRICGGRSYNILRRMTASLKYKSSG
jgi:hypothetical protein